MATIEKIEAHKRTSRGTTASRRLRSEGIVPGNIYGHKEKPTAVKIDGDIARAMVLSGSKVFDLETEGTLDKVLLKDVQWDTFSKHIMHIDFLRVDPNERVTVEVPVHLRGTAPGAEQGGVLEQPMHAVEVECLAVEIPNHIDVRIGHLNIGDAFLVSELKNLPQGLVVTSPEESVIVQVTHEAEEVEPEDVDAAPVEPERIGEDKKEGEDSE